MRALSPYFIHSSAFFFGCEAFMAILSVVLAQMASYDTCETQWAVLHFDPATAKITRNNLGGRGPDPCLGGQYPPPSSSPSRSPPSPCAPCASGARAASRRRSRACTSSEEGRALDLDVETSIVDDDETRETAPLSPAASSEAVVSPRGWLSSWLWGKD